MQSQVGVQTAGGTAAHSVGVGLGAGPECLVWSVGGSVVGSGSGEWVGMGAATYCMGVTVASGSSNRNGCKAVIMKQEGKGGWL